MIGVFKIGTTFPFDLFVRVEFHPQEPFSNQQINVISAYDFSLFTNRQKALKLYLS